MSQQQEQALAQIEEEVWTAVTEQILRLPPNEWQWLLHDLEFWVLQQLEQRGISSTAYLAPER